MRLKDKVSIITGAAQGIGATFAVGFAEEGARIVVADILDGKGVVEA
ncbi:MAG: SDR family NAD(P)-dependent oxidoreductase, partial [Dehalococcoidia bacterium]